MFASNSQNAFAAFAVKYVESVRFTLIQKKHTFTYFIIISHQTVSDDGNRTLPEGATKHLGSGIEHITEESERQQGVQVEDD